MGYTTQFRGCFKFDRPLTAAHRLYLSKFAETRRMKRNPDLTRGRPDSVRDAVKLPVGVDGGYFVGAEGSCGQEWGAADIIQCNSPPAGQPGLWCQWVPSACGGYLGWNGGEKFYHYTEWLEYLIEHFIKPWGYSLTGVVRFQGEEIGDAGVITVEENAVFPIHAELPNPTCHPAADFDH